MKETTRNVIKKSRVDPSDLSLNEKLIKVDRVTKVVKGGKRMRFRALVVVGDGQGHVGSGIGKAKEVPEAVRKAGVVAKKNLVSVPLVGNTIPHEILVKYGASKVLLKPAVPGTGLIAGGGIRAVLESAGVKDVLTKSLGSTGIINVVRATIMGLSCLRYPKETATERKSELKVDIEVKPVEQNAS